VTATGSSSQPLRLGSPEATALLNASILLGFVEGASFGRISAKGVTDPPDRFNGCTRQEFDQPAEGSEDGGKVWEHWCTTRDIRADSHIGSSVLTAFIQLLSVLGDHFVPTVARGRRQYGHPKQLWAMVVAGLTSLDAATRVVTPVAIPAVAERRLAEATPAAALDAVEQLSWNSIPSYYMSSRRISSWSSTASVIHDLATFGC